MKRLLLAGVALALAGCAPSVADAPMADQWIAIDLAAEPVDLGVEQIGRLRFRGGLALSAPQEIFGGLSGLEVMDDGRLIAVSDNADWLEAQIVLNEAGALVGVSGARMAFMRDERGAPFASKRAGDAEDVAQLADGRFAVAFEQTQNIRIYDLNRDGPFGAAVLGPRLDGAQHLPRNASLEAITSNGFGVLLVGAEGGGGPTPLWRAAIARADEAPIAARYSPARGYSLTGLDRLPEGGFVALERFYAPIIGPRARLTRFATTPSDGESVVETEELARLGPPLPLDNFEGVAAVRMADGATRLYIISDNNFSTRQRTLLYAFDIVEAERAP
jgi:hypothetical protein